MKRRSFFALAIGGIAAAVGFKRKPENPFRWGVTDEQFLEIWRSYDSRERSRLWHISNESMMRRDKETRA